MSILVCQFVIEYTRRKIEYLRSSVGTLSFSKIPEIQKLETKS